MKLGDLVEVDWVDPSLFKSNIGVVIDTSLSHQGAVEVITTSGLRAWLSMYDLKVVCDAN